MTELKEGIHRNLPMEAYVGDPCPEPSLSASTIRTIVNRSPLAARRAHPRFEGVSSVARAADVGSAAHAVLLEGDDVLEVIVDHENYRTKAAKEARAAAYSADKIPLFARERAAIDNMMKVARPALAAIPGEGIPEATVIWKEGDVWARARPDWLASAVVDYKTAKNAEPGAWIRRVLFGSGYDISAAWYLRGLRELGEPCEEYLFLVQEVAAPYDYSWVSVDEECLERANKVINHAISVWSECLAQDTWPGYEKRVHYADMPPYRAEQFEELTTRPR